MRGSAKEDWTFEILDSQSFYNIFENKLIGIIESKCLVRELFIVPWLGITNWNGKNMWIGQSRKQTRVSMGSG